MHLFYLDLITAIAIEAGFRKAAIGKVRSHFTPALANKPDCSVGYHENSFWEVTLRLLS